MTTRIEKPGFRSLMVGALVSVPVVLTLTLSFGANSEVADFFSSRQYNQAQNSLSESEDNISIDELLFWRAHLSSSPDEALMFLNRGLDDGHIPVESRFSLVLDAASIEMAQGNFRQALGSLLPLLEEHSDSAPGEAFLLASIGLRALGELQRAREMLASVHPEDPSFQLARHYLGEISLELGDAVLALRYFDSAAAVITTEPPTRMLAGRWQALRIKGQDVEADNLQRNLEQTAPGSLALLEIRYHLRSEQEELAARLASKTLESPAADEQPEANDGRYSLQLGAFSDRSLALDFLRRYSEHQAQLRIDEVQDQRGQFLYKVRYGHFVSRAQALSQARKLGNQLGIEVFVTDLTD